MPHGLRTELSRLRTPEQARATRVRAWADALLSRWCGLALFAAAFVPYLVLVEHRADSVRWARPLLLSVLAVCLFQLVGATIVRWSSRRIDAARRARMRGRVLLRRCERLLRVDAARVDGRRLPDGGALGSESMRVRSVHGERSAAESNHATTAPPSSGGGDARRTDDRTNPATGEGLGTASAGAHESDVSGGTETGSTAFSPELFARAAAVDRALAFGDAAAISSADNALRELEPRLTAQSRRRGVMSWQLVALVLGALLLRMAVIEPFRIPTGSMLPTVQLGDQVLVNKFVYGVRLPFLNRVPFVFVRRPQRGDVIVFESPVDPGTDLIKRVAGVPGDTVQLVDEQLYVNGVPQPRRLTAATEPVDDREEGHWVQDSEVGYEETLSGVRHAILQDPEHPHEGEVEGPFVVPPESVFVLGDNRDHSEDSRYGLGVTAGVEFVPYGNIKGKAMVVGLSFSRGGWLSPLAAGTGLRVDRLFLPVR